MFIPKKHVIMKKITVIIAVLLISFTNLFSQSTHFSVESQNVIINNGTKFLPIIDVYGSHSFNDKLAMFGWIRMDQNWSESYTGLTYSPLSWIHLSAGLGIETNENPLRLGTSVLLTNKKGFALFIYENGGSGYWYRGILNCKFNKYIGAGLMSQKGLGTGVRTEINVTKNLQLWLAGLWNGNNTFNGFISVKAHF